MNDDDLAPRVELASAFLDGELEPDERATAALDPDVVASAEVYRRIRTAIGDVPPVPEPVRAAALAAALAEFDATHSHASADTAPAPVLTMLRQRRTQRVQRRLIGFAAATLIVVVGAAAVLAGRDDQQRTSSSATAPTDMPVGTRELSKAAPAATEAPGIFNATAPAAPPVDTPQALQAYAASQSTMASDSAAGAESAAETAAPAAGGAMPAAMSPCATPHQVVIGQITVFGAPAFAVRDTTNGELSAVDAADCHVLFTVAP